MYSNGIQAQTAYRDSLILQADPLELVRILYRAAVESVSKAREHLRRSEIKPRAREITRAIEIVNELGASIDLEQGGEIARNLVELYDYLARLLLDANFRQADEPLAQAEQLLRTLLDGWERCRPETAAAPAAETPRERLSLAC